MPPLDLTFACPRQGAAMVLATKSAGSCQRLPVVGEPIGSYALRVGSGQFSQLPIKSWWTRTARAWSRASSIYR